MAGGTDGRRYPPSSVTDRIRDCYERVESTCVFMCLFVNVETREEIATRKATRNRYENEKEREREEIHGERNIKA